MYLYVLQSIKCFWDDHAQLSADAAGMSLLEKVRNDIAHFKHIDFYSATAGNKIAESIALLKAYEQQLQLVSKKVHLLPIEVLKRFNTMLKNLDKNVQKLEQLNDVIPNGVLDLKRIFYLKHFSTDATEQQKLTEELEVLQKYLSEINSAYLDLVKRGGTLDFMLWRTTHFYWSCLQDYRAKLEKISDEFNNACALTSLGTLSLKCLSQALMDAPSTGELNKAVRMMSKVNEQASVLKKVGFYSQEAHICCRMLQKMDKKFFYLPHSNQMYHFDYNPRRDLLGTGGDCFGQTMSFILGLMRGKIKWLCPEASLLNYQIDQTHTLLEPKEHLASAETEVSADSVYDMIQWDDLSVVFSEERFHSGDLCGLSFYMNEYSMSKTNFTPGHILAVAKLDTKLSPYKYLVYEKEMGAFGLTDDASLELVIKDVMQLYRGMHYSRVKLIKYGQATVNTYAFVNSVKPVDPSIGLGPIKFALFEAAKPVEQSDLGDNPKNSQNPV